MQVKKLELLGFKSFATKTTIHFEPGVTAIVGPNGSGKTNLVDAIRWILGEQNPRDLRAPRLEDVIFNGTDRRAPLSMAEVHLTIDNQQGLLPIAFTEVTISRRVFRSGESECAINQQPCRLKDIRELFLGTGLGGGAYAIIEQGHIDLILSSKPEERRLVFEEASGIAKYLAKKQETLRRLDEVEEHLVRIADVLGEVRRQVGALERAANKARQYKAQWETLKQLELKLAADELRTQAARAEELAAAARTLTAQREQADADKQAQMAALEAANAQVSRIQQELQELRASLIACTSRIDQHESQSALKSRWLDELTQQARQLEQEAAQAEERMGQMAAQRERVGGAEAEVRAQRGGLEEQMSRAREELAVSERAVEEALRAVEAAKEDVFASAQEATHQRNRLAEASSRLAGLTAQLGRLEAQQVQWAARAEQARTRQEALLQERQTLTTQVEALQRRLEAAQQQLEAAAARRHELMGRLTRLRDQLAVERAQVALREDLWRRYEGFPEAVKLLMSRSIEGLIGPLVDVVRAEPGYEALVEAALGPLAEALIVQDRQALSRCRQHLQEQRLEGCRFLVLSDCPVALSLEPATLHDGLAGAVKQHVRVEPQYQPLVDWLLNDSWIVDDIQRLLGQTDVPPVRLVSPRGDRWDRRSWRFGGGQASAQARIGRQQRWEQARAALQALEQEFQQLEAALREAECDWQARLSEQEAGKGELAQAAPRLQTLETHLSQLAQETDDIAVEQRNSAAEAQEFTGQREELRAVDHRAQQAVEEAQARQTEGERRLNDAQAACEAARQRRQELVIAVTQCEATHQTLAERGQALQMRLSEIDADEERLRQELGAKRAQREDALTRAHALAQELATHRDTAQQEQAERARLAAEVSRVAQALREEEARRDQLLPQVLAAEQRLAALLRALQEQEQERSAQAMRRDHLIERFREVYQIEAQELDAAQRAEQPPLTQEERADAARQLSQLRAKLGGLGPVSLGSVEEYDELKRRLEFLQGQRQDLIAARDDLKASITQINRTARAQFRQTFEQITQAFQHYFSRLFQGGEATLLLLDEEDVLESGIDIIARPPGKRLQSITLLSGGERALTAVALLFALFKIRPSPFCILDEIDAPLDEANVDRFTRVLEEFLELSQFILVTHNKKTITKADCLYGVTMEEAGVSMILSAKLTPPPQPALAS
jgi:chromosome segregation protein